MLQGGTFNRFEAEKQLNEHCLHSTVSAIQKKYGITVDRVMETIPGYRLFPTRCMRYSISLSEAPKGFELLANELVTDGYFKNTNEALSAMREGLR